MLQTTEDWNFGRFILASTTATSTTITTSVTGDCIITLPIGWKITNVVEEKDDRNEIDELFKKEL